VDNFLQNHRHHYDIGVDAKPVERYREKWGGRKPTPLEPYYFLLEHHVQRFMTPQVSADRNPFINRFVHYQDDCRPAIGQFRQAFTNLLELYGSHIWHLGLKVLLPMENNVGLENASLRNAYNMIQRYLCLMPNLRTLDIRLYDIQNDRAPRSDFTWRRLLYTNRLPKLEHLFTLKMMDLPTCLQKGLMKASSHLQSFCSSYSVPARCLQYSFTTAALDNLQEIDVSLVHDEDYNTLRSLSWPALKAVRIRCQFAEIDRVFRTISESSFATTLKRLILSPLAEEREWDGEMVVIAKLELAQLESLKMIVPYQVKNGVENVDFLLPGCASLVNLELEMYAPLEKPRVPRITTRSMKKKKKESDVLIQFVKYENTKEILESNIWELLAHLNQVKIVWKSRSGSYTPCCRIGPRPENLGLKNHQFTRGQYEALQQNRINELI